MSKVEQWITYADKRKPPCPFNRRWRLSQTISFVFGKDKIQHRWSVLRFNPHLGKEERIADMEEHIWASYSLVGESIFVVGGDTAQGRFSTSVEEFLVGERRWCKRASLGVGRNGHAAAVVTESRGEALIGVFSGYNGGCLSSCEVFEVSRDRCFKLPDLREKRNDTAAACLPACPATVKSSFLAVIMTPLHAGFRGVLPPASRLAREGDLVGLLAASRTHENCTIRAGSDTLSWENHCRRGI
nr:unnamed protein product [Spirometra erinaceieuropaei]